MSLVLTENDLARLNNSLLDFLKQSDSKCALLIDQDGQCLVRKGFTKSFDCDAVAALIAGSFASNRALAKLVGENEFTVMFNQGATDHIHNVLIDDNTILAVIFDDRTTIGMVRLYSKEAAKQIRVILKSLRESMSNGTGGGDAEINEAAQSRVDDLFTK